MICNITHLCDTYSFKLKLTSQETEHCGIKAIRPWWCLRTTIFNLLFTWVQHCIILHRYYWRKLLRSRVNNVKCQLGHGHHRTLAYWLMCRHYRAPIDEGSQRTVVIGDQLITSDGLAVDWIYNHLYWTDTGKNHIELSDLQGNMRKILIRDRLEEPRSIALNPLDG